MNHFRTVRPFCLNGWGVSYNEKGRSIFVSFCKNGTITLYCHITYAYSLAVNYVKIFFLTVVLYIMLKYAINRHLPLCKDRMGGIGLA